MEKGSMTSMLITVALTTIAVASGVLIANQVTKAIEKK